MHDEHAHANHEGRVSDVKRGVFGHANPRVELFVQPCSTVGVEPKKVGDGNLMDAVDGVAKCTRQHEAKRGGNVGFVAGELSEHV